MNVSKVAKHASWFLALTTSAFVACGPGTGDGPNDSGGEGGGGNGGESSGGTSSGGSTTLPPPEEGDCVTEKGEEFDSLKEIGCQADFDRAAAEPTDSSLPGALTVKIVIDRDSDDRLYFLNTGKYPQPYGFASEHLTGVGSEAEFNDSYVSSERRFYLGAVTYYEGPEKWVYELAPYDTASAAMVVEAFTAIKEAAFFGSALYFHPSGTAAGIASELPASVPVVSTEELVAETDYQALNLGTSCGRLVFKTTAELDTSVLSFQDIVVLDAVPNDVSITQGVITSEFQTPLSHIAVLSQNRGTPNMALRGSFDAEDLRALEGAWIKLTVGAFAYSITEIDEAEAQDCVIKPAPIEIGSMNLDVTEIADVLALYDPDSGVPLREQISSHVSAYGGKASHYGALAHIPEANVAKAIAIPVYYYSQFMAENGLDERVVDLLADEDFMTDADVRDAALDELRTDMELAPLNPDFMALLTAKLEADFPDARLRFRSSTNVEDLGNYTGAGQYSSASGQLGDAGDPIEDAIREVWASVWHFRAFDEREYSGIDHTNVGMAILAHKSFPNEEANGAAVTANPFDESGAGSAFYVNVQQGESSVVDPPKGITTDQYLHYFDFEGEPVVYIGHSNVVEEGQTVLTTEQIHELGVAMKAIHQFFQPAYGAEAEGDWYAMGIEFKFDGEEGAEPALTIKQARPYLGRNQ